MAETSDGAAIDPVCGMEVDTATAKWHSIYQGFEYFFCNPGCKKRFDDEPDEFVGSLKEDEQVPYY